MSRVAPDCPCTGKVSLGVTPSKRREGGARREGEGLAFSRETELPHGGVSGRNASQPFCLSLASCSWALSDFQPRLQWFGHAVLLPGFKLYQSWLGHLCLWPQTALPAHMSPVLCGSMSGLGAVICVQRAVLQRGAWCSNKALSPPVCSWEVQVPVPELCLFRQLWAQPV